MHNDDSMIGRLLTRRELVALFGASAVAAMAHRVSGQAAQAGAGSAGLPACVVVPQQTEGPYFVDEKLLRSDIRADSSTGAVKAGAPLALAIKVSQVTPDGGCAPLPGAQVDFWQCDAMGAYSDVTDKLFDTKGQKFLRGHQITDAAGGVKFVTIYPGWYPGRAVHIHFKVRTEPGGDAGLRVHVPVLFRRNVHRPRPRRPAVCHTHWPANAKREGRDLQGWRAAADARGRRGGSRWLSGDVRPGHEARRPAGRPRPSWRSGLTPV